MIRPILLAALATTAAQAACPPPFTGAGDGTFYNSTGLGNCTIEFSDTDLIAALNAPQWAGSVHCGECLVVTGPLGMVAVKVVDQCPECLLGDLDLSPAAFTAIANLADGRVPITWQRVECPVSGAADYRFQGSNPFFIKLQILDHRVGVSTMEVRPAASAMFTNMPRVGDNFFQASFGTAATLPLTVRTTGTTGEPILHQLSSIVNDTILVGSSQFAPCAVPVLFANGFE